MHWTEVRIRVPESPFLTTEEVAVLAKVSDVTIRRWVRDGKFPAPRRPGIWSGVSVGIWLAWQDYVSGSTDTPDGEEEAPAENPVKRKT